MASLHWYENGMDFADALHLAGSAGQATEFKTFDQAFVKSARKLGTTPVVTSAKS